MGITLKNVYVDMDGVLAKFRKDIEMETLYEKGYFLELEPIQSSIEMLNLLIRSLPNHVYILTSYLEDSLYAKKEKLLWALQYTDIRPEHIIFVPSFSSKSDYLKNLGVARSSDILIDDYGVNLTSWHGTSIKFINDINNTKKKSYQNILDYRDNPLMNAFRIQLLMA